MRRADGRSNAVRAALAALVGLAASCGGNDPPRLKASPLPAAAPIAGISDVRLQLRNIGGRPLALDGVGRVCGCVPTDTLPATLAPGATAMLALRCRAPRIAGTAERALVVRTSDPRKPAVAVPLALPGAVPGPAPLYLGYVGVGTSAVRDVVLPGPVAVDGLAPSAEPALALEPMPTRPDGAAGVRVRFTPSRPGVVRAILDLGPTGGPLPVVAVGYGEAMAVPAEVRLPVTVTGALPAITVVGVGATPLAITGADVPDGLQGELRTIVPGRQLRLVLRRVPGRSPGAGTIRLRGADGTTPVLAIPVVAAGDDHHASGAGPRGTPAT